MEDSSLWDEPPLKIRRCHDEGSPKSSNELLKRPLTTQATGKEEVEVDLSRFTIDSQPFDVPLLCDIKFLGDVRSDSLCVITPPNDGANKPPDNNDGNVFPDNSRIKSKLEQVERIFKDKKSLSYLKSVVKSGKNNGCRMIQAERFEMFVQADKYGSSVWHAILQRGGFENPSLFTEELVEYATTMAKQDPRVRRKKDWCFGNFSMIVTYSNVPAQEPHIDLLFPSFQFAIMVSDLSPTTKYFEVPERNRITSGKELAVLWSKIDPSIPDELIQFLTRDPDVNNKLELYGEVFSVTTPCISRDHTEESPFFCHGMASVPRGTLLSLPGGKVHAGPASDSPFRAVLFFSGLAADEGDGAKYLPSTDAKTNKKLSVQGETYDPDSQYSSVILMSSIIFILWRQFGMTQKSRIYLLKRLCMYVASTTLAGGRWNKVRWYRHFFVEKEFQAMLRTIESRVLNRDRELQHRVNPGSFAGARLGKWDGFYENYAKNDRIAPLHVETLEYVGEFRLISDADLHIEYSGTYHPATLFYRSIDDRIVIYYRESNEWEGSKSDDHYRLKWISNNDTGKRETGKETLRFDGTNGFLSDSNGEIFSAKCIKDGKEALSGATDNFGASGAEAGMPA